MNYTVAPFILRFQEICLGAETEDTFTGTTTFTAVRAEQIDADPDKHHFGVLPEQGASTGTTTATFVRAEGADEDPGACSRCAIPRDASPLSGTETMTRARGEAADQDPGGQRLRAIPPACSLS